MFASTTWIYLLTLTLVSCIASRDGGNIQGPYTHDGPPQYQVHHGRRRRDTHNDTMTSSEKEQLIQIQNDLRRQVYAANMIKLYWGNKLENDARSLAEKCDLSVLNNSPELPRMRHTNSKYFESQALHTSAWNAFKHWFEEMAHTDLLQCTDKILCDQVKKVLLARSLVVGCAMKSCDPAITKTSLKKGQLLVCEYANMDSYGENKETPGLTYIKGEPCTQCNEFFTRCDDKLCEYPPEGIWPARDAARPIPAHPSAILIALATGLAMTAFGTRLGDF